MAEGDSALLAPERDVDALAQRLASSVSFEWGPETQDYGLREVAIKDLNGYYLVFARDV